MTTVSPPTGLIPFPAPCSRCGEVMWLRVSDHLCGPCGDAADHYRFTDTATVEGAAWVEVA